ncbi:MAG: acetyl-CoA C-acyltransferase [Myxococcota bacterium]
MSDREFWLLQGVRTPFTKVDGALSDEGAIEISIPVVQEMIEDIDDCPDMLVWGTVAPNLAYSNIAREVWVDSGLDPNVPALSTVMACSTSMAAVFDAAGVLGHGGRDVAMCGGVESMSRVQIGLSQSLSDWLRRATGISSPTDALDALKDLSIGDIGLHIPSIKNRATGKSMGEHCEEMAKEWDIPRDWQDEIALNSHNNSSAAQDAGFFDDLIVPYAGASKDAFPRSNTSMEKLGKLRPAFDRENGTLTAGNSSPLTDGAAGVWLSTEDGLDRFDDDRPRVKMLDWEVAAVDIFTEGLLMAPAYAIPRILARNDLGYDDIELWEIHEAFAAQVACHIKALEDEGFLKDRVGVDRDFGDFPTDRINPNGGSVALGHPFGATGARILSQAVKELAEMEPGTRAIVSICADGGLGTVALLEA